MRVKVVGIAMLAVFGIVLLWVATNSTTAEEVARSTTVSNEVAHLASPTKNESTKVGVSVAPNQVVETTAFEAKTEAVVAPTPEPATVAPQPPTGTMLPPHEDMNPAHCETVSGRDRIVTDWRNEVRNVCVDAKSGITIREYVQRHFEYKPQIFVYENVDVTWYNGDLLPNPCPRGTWLEMESSNDVQGWAQGEEVRSEFQSRNVKVVKGPTFIRQKRFDLYNIYEAFHAYINMYFVLKTLQLNQSEVQFVMTDDGHGDSPHDDMWWNSMNGGAYPVLYTRNNGQNNYGMVEGIPIRVGRLVRAGSTGTSILCSNHGALQGRGRDHHCKSAAFRAGTAWLRDNFGSTIKYTLVRPLPKITVLWSSRRPYKRGDHLHHVGRTMPRENEFVQAMQDALGSGYNVINFDFGSTNPDKCIEAASNADVIAGVHGAGLTWSVFLPRHGGLVELFGGDRGAHNRHYHNLASLADIHYRSMSLGHFDWSPALVTQVTNFIKEMPLNRADSEPS